MNNANSNCIVCSSDKLIHMLSIENSPVHCNLLYHDYQSALNARKGKMDLVYCRNCGHVFNLSFSYAETDYSVEYENSLHFSGTFNQYAHDLANDLIKKYLLNQKKIVEIGCGKGDFLNLICKTGNNKGYGFDKSYSRDEFSDGSNGLVEFHNDFFNERYSNIAPDFLICRHVLEHIFAPQAFLSSIKNSVQNCAGYFEVPNFFFLSRGRSIWDVIYEHCSYYTPLSLQYLFESCGFSVKKANENYGRQFLSLEFCLPEKSPSSDRLASVPDDYEQEAEIFAGSYVEKIERWNSTIDDIRRHGQKAVVWGGGSKGVSFLNMLNVSGVVDYVVDINPRKKGKFVACTGQQYISPAQLPEIKPASVIIMNEIYAQEIKSEMDHLGIHPEILLA